MAKKKSNQQQVEIKLAEIRGEAGQGQPEMVWHLPFVVTAGGAGAALKGVELAAKGVGKAIEARVAPLQFYIRDSWLQDAREHRVEVRIHNTTKNGIYIESFDIKREYRDANEIDPNRTTQPTLVSIFFAEHESVCECPLLFLAEEEGSLQLSLPKVDRKKMKSEFATATVQFADLGKRKSDTISFEFRLRWQPHSTGG
jgi:hypothetical protein